MPLFLGIDTSNYTTSTALYNTDDNSVVQFKKLLPVKNGELGLRQSDAVFHHTKQLPQMMGQLFDKPYHLAGIGVSVRPRNMADSYMPCFLAGEGLAVSLSSVNDIPLYRTSHQVGHVLAALYSADCQEYINNPFIAFHVSGGTTDCLLVEPDNDEVIRITQIASSLDLKAGQAIDRVGVMLGLEFPCGKALDALSRESNVRYRIKPVMKGLDCCLSGIENRCKKMFSDGEKPCDIANFCISSVYAAVRKMTAKALEQYGNLPLVYAGGVMSNSMIRERISAEFSGKFAQPEFSCDNAVGTAVFASLKSKGI